MQTQRCNREIHPLSVNSGPRRWIHRIQHSKRRAHWNRSQKQICCGHKEAGYRNHRSRMRAIQSRQDNRNIVRGAAAPIDTA